MRKCLSMLLVFVIAFTSIGITQVEATTYDRTMNGTVNIYAPGASELSRGNKYDIGATISGVTNLMHTNMYIRYGSFNGTEVYKKEKITGTNIWESWSVSASATPGTYYIILVVYNNKEQYIKEYKTVEIVEIPTVTFKSVSPKSGVVGSIFEFTVESNTTVAEVELWAGTSAKPNMEFLGTMGSSTPSGSKKIWKKSYLLNSTQYTRVTAYGYSKNYGSSDTDYVSVTVDPANVAVIGINMNKTLTTIQAGKTETLTATVNPSSATNKAVTWSSSNTNVATVNNNGVVTAISAGTTTITVKTADGSKTATCTVTVSAEQSPTKVPKITDITPKNTTVKKGESVTISVTANSDTDYIAIEIDGEKRTRSVYTVSGVNRIFTAAPWEMGTDGNKKIIAYPCDSNGNRIGNSDVSTNLTVIDINATIRVDLNSTTAKITGTYANGVQEIYFAASNITNNSNGNRIVNETLVGDGQGKWEYTLTGLATGRYRVAVKTVAGNLSEWFQEEFEVQPINPPSNNTALEAAIDRANKLREYRFTPQKTISKSYDGGTRTFYAGTEYQGFPYSMGRELTPSYDMKYQDGKPTTYQGFDCSQYVGYILGIGTSNTTVTINNIAKDPNDDRLYYVDNSGDVRVGDIFNYGSGASGHVIFISAVYPENGKYYVEYMDQHGGQPTKDIDTGYYGSTTKSKMLLSDAWAKNISGKTNGHHIRVTAFYGANNLSTSSITGEIFALGINEAISLSQITAKTGETVEIPIILNTAEQNGNMTLTFDSSKISFVSAENGDILSGILVSKLENSNTLKLTFVDPSIEQTGTLINLKFKIMKDVANGTIIPLKLHDIKLGDNTVDDVSSSITVNKNIYTVTFNPDGGDLIYGELTQRVAQGESAVAPVLEKPGYDFVQWSIAYDNVTKDLTIQAIWRKVEAYTVTFDIDGGDLIYGELIQIVRKGESAIAPTVSKLGYEFVKWSSTFDNVTKDLMVKAEWKKNKETFTVKFDLDGGNRTGGGQLSQTVEAGKSVEAPLVAKTGFIFVKWDMSLENIDDNMTITAEWEPEPSKYILGDVNGDGEIDSADALLIMKYSIHLIDLSPEQKKATDVNKDGDINAADGIIILRTWAGYETILSKK